MVIEKKSEWKTPELIVLVRSKPEEAVLGACKILLHRSLSTSDAHKLNCRTQRGTGACIDDLCHDMARS